MSVNLTLLKRVGVIAVLAIIVAAVAMPTQKAATPTVDAQGGPDRPELSVEAQPVGPFEPVYEAERSTSSLIPVRVTFDAPAAVELDASFSAESIQTAEFSTASSIQTLESMGFEIVARNTLLTNAVQMFVTEADLALLASVPGVRHVTVIPVMHAHNASSVPFIDADDWWVATGSAGAGVTVAVIDSGVNYEHMNFGACSLNRDGPGGGTGNGVVGDDTLDDEEFDILDLPDTFGDEVYGNTIGVPCKVIGGIDFYSGDDDPMGCNGTNLPVGNDDGGHGTHVAGSAVGYGVLGGTAYAGPYDATTYSNSFQIGPGVAPQANLLAIRTIGCNGSTSGSWFPDPVTLSIEWAVANGADVINMSLGSDYNNGGYEEVIANAALAGTIVVASAGNSGDAHYITGSPAGASDAISVAASDDRIAYDATVSATGPSGLIINAGTAAVGVSYDGPQAPPTPGLTAPVSLTTPANGCSAITEDLTGKIALIDRGTCTFATKVINAQLRNAAGVIIWDATNDTFGSTLSAPGALITNVYINNADGTLLRNAVLVNPPDSVTATLIGTNTDDLRDTIATFTSRGPRRAQWDTPVVLKPDIAAPGVIITSSHLNDSSTTSVTSERPAGEPHTPSSVVPTSGTTYNGYRPPSGFDPIFAGTISGTSMASPHIAGVMALLHANYGNTLTVAQYKALAMNHTTSLYTVTGPSAIEWGPSRVGAGRIDFSKLITSLGNEAIAYDSARANLVSLSYGNIEVVSNGTAALDTSVTRSVTVEDFSGSARNYTVTYDPVNDMAGVNFVPSVASIPVPANGTATFNVVLEAEVSAMTTPNAQDPASLAILNDGYHWLTEEAGYLILTPDSGGAALRLPVYALVRVASDMSAEDTITLPNTVGTATVALSGTDLFTGGSFPNDVVSLAVPFELTAADLVGDTNPNDYATPFTDIEFVGVTEVGNVLYIGVNTVGEWSTHSDATIRIHLDFCNDGNYEWFVYPSYSSTNSAQDRKRWFFVDVEGRFGAAGVSYGYSSPINEISPLDFTTYVFNNDSMVFPITLIDFDADPACADGIVHYYLESFARHDFDLLSFQVLSDTVGSAGAPLVFDYGVNQNFTFESQITGYNIPVVVDLNSGSFDVDYNLAGDSVIPDILLLHFHNKDNTAEVIDILLDSDYQPVVQAFEIGGWDYFADASAEGGGYLCSNDPYDELIFEGSRDNFNVIHYKSSAESRGGGTFGVDVNGTLQRTIDTSTFGDGFLTSNFAGFLTDYYLIRVYPAIGNVCIDAVINDVLPSEVPAAQTWIQTYLPTGNDLNATNGRNNCAINLARMILTMSQDGRSAIHDLDVLFLDEGQIVQSQRLTFPGLGYAITIPFGFYYHSGATTDVPGHLDVEPRPAALVGTAEMVVQFRRENECDAVTVEYTCSTGVATITQNQSTCIFN